MAYFKYRGETKRAASLRLTKGKHEHLVYKRLSAGWSIRRAFTEPVYKTKNTYKGTTAYKMSLILTGGRSMALVSNRLRLGWSKEKAFTEPVMFKRN